MLGELYYKWPVHKHALLGRKIPVLFGAIPKPLRETLHKCWWGGTTMLWLLMLRHLWEREERGGRVSIGSLLRFAADEANGHTAIVLVFGSGCPPPPPMSAGSYGELPTRYFSEIPPNFSQFSRIPLQAYFPSRDFPSPMLRRGARL